MSLEGWSGDSRTHLRWGNRHHDNIGWVALEGFHLEHFQTILFAPPGLPAGTHTHTHTHTHLSCLSFPQRIEGTVCSPQPATWWGEYLPIPPRSSLPLQFRQARLTARRDSGRKNAEVGGTTQANKLRIVAVKRPRRRDSRVACG